MEWEQQVLEWEADNTRFCPYDLPEESASSSCLLDDQPFEILLFTEVSLAVVRKQIAEEEYVNAAAQGRQHSIQSSTSDFILAGMDIEERQYVLSFYALS